ncbi:SAM domain-containing protein [Mesorhizobium sp. CN2-181]|uniref:SAM domain-containing protein n=1 Tax=Mesorhizobium yinganensis TaxID=3157707 RepID=UPI0032B87B6A
MYVQRLMCREGGEARELRSWLDDLELGKYFETLVANDVDFDLLPELDDSDLERLGISFGNRKRLLRAIAKLKPQLHDAGPTPELAKATASGPERRQLTVVFVDLVGSTELSTQIPSRSARTTKAVTCRYLGGGAYRN